MGSERAAEPTKKVVVFTCGNEEYAVPVEAVVSIEKQEHINPIPHLPAYVLGLTKIRGELIPILDFERILYERPLDQADAKVIVMHTESLPIGLLVKEAKEILDVAPEEEAQLGLVSYQNTRYFSSIANLEDRVVTLVDPEALVRSLEGIQDIRAHVASMREQ